MAVEICNPQHISNITHIDINNLTLVCKNDIEIYSVSHPFSELVPLLEYANEVAEELRKINSDTQVLLEKIEKIKPFNYNAQLFEKIEKAFNEFYVFAHSVKETLIAKLKSKDFSSTNSVANDVCSFAEETSLSSINLRKAIINNDVIDMRKCLTGSLIHTMRSKYNFYRENLMGSSISPRKGFDIFFRDPNRDPDLVLSQVGISFVGYTEASLKYFDYKDQFTSMSPDKFSPLIPLKKQEFEERKDINNLQKMQYKNVMSEKEEITRIQKVPLIDEIKKESNSPIIQFKNQAKENRPSPQVDSSRLQNSYSNISSIQETEIGKKVNYCQTLHHYNRISKKFLFYSLNTNSIHSFPIPNLSAFPYDGNFPSIFYNNNLFFCGGIIETKVLCTSFMMDLEKKNVLKKSDMINGRSLHCLEEIEGIIYAIGGKFLKQELNQCEGYNNSRDVWIESYPMNYARANATTFIFEGHICYIVGGNNEIKDKGLIERRKFKEKESTWTIVHFRSIPNFILPIRSANSCKIGDGKFLIFGGYSDKNLMSSCIYNAKSDCIENIHNMANGYFINTNKSPCILENGEIKAIDESQKIHAFNINFCVWNMIDISHFKLVE